MVKCPRIADTVGAPREHLRECTSAVTVTTFKSAFVLAELGADEHACNMMLSFDAIPDIFFVCMPLKKTNVS